MLTCKREPDEFHQCKIRCGVGGPGKLRVEDPSRLETNRYTMQREVRYRVYLVDIGKDKRVRGLWMEERERERERESKERERERERERVRE